jgi:hypothetical protein
MWREVAVPLRGGWVAELRVEEEGWRPVITELRVRCTSPGPPPGGIPLTILRGLTQQTVLEALRHEHESMLRRADPAYHDLGLVAFDEWVAAAPAPSAHARPGRNRRWSDEDLARLAVEYIALAAEGRGAKPVEQLAKRYVFKQPQYVQRLLRLAEARGIVGPPIRGKAGRLLTERGTALAQQLHLLPQ